MPPAQRFARPFSSRHALLLLAAITLLGGALRLYLIGDKGLWLDEAFSVWLGQHPLGEMWAWVARIDQHPPLYYSLLQFWMRLGDNASTVPWPVCHGQDGRLLSAMTSTLTIPIVFFLGRRLVGPLVGLLAALILAVSPFHVRFAQETRMYALLAFCGAMAMLCLAHLLAKSGGELGEATTGLEPSGGSMRESDQLPGYGMAPARPGKPPIRGGGWTTVARGLPWIGYVLFTAATLLTHNTAVLLLLAMNLFVLGLTASLSMTGDAAGLEHGRHSSSRGPARLRPPALRGWLLAQAAVVLLWGIVWFRPFITQVSGVLREFWLPAPTWRTVVDALGNFLSAHLPRQQMPWVDVIWPVYLALFVLGIAYLRRRPAVVGLLLTLFLTPVILELLVSLRRPIFYDRTLIWATIPLYLLLAAGITALRRPPVMLGVVAVVTGFAGLSLHNYYANFQRDGWKEAAAYVGSQMHDDDLILFNASWVQIPFDFYFRDVGRPVTEHGLPGDLFDRGVLEPKMAEADLPRLRELSRDRKRVWLVYSHNWYTDPDGLIPATLSDTLRLSQTQGFEKLEVQLYTRAAP